MNGFEQFLDQVNNGYVWGVPLLAVLFGTHLFLTVRLGFIQKHILHAIRLSLTRKTEGVGEISHFGALVTSLAATIGTGNICRCGCRGCGRRPRGSAVDVAYRRVRYCN